MMADSDGLKALLTPEVAALVQSLRVNEGVVSAVLDGGGLDDAGRVALEAGV